MPLAIAPRVKVNTADLKRAFHRFTREDQKKIMDSVLRVDARGFVRDVVAITPPGHEGNPLKNGAKGEGAVNAGLNAIRRDLLGGRSMGNKMSAGIFMALEDGLIAKLQASDAQRTAKGEPTEKFRLFRVKGFQYYETERELFQPSATAEMMDAHHAKFWRRGRIAGGGIKDVARGSRAIYTAKMVVSKTAFAAYFAKLSERLGKLAGGWGKAAKDLGVPLPKIARRHSSGMCQFIIGDNSWRVRITSAVPYATEADISRRVTWVLDSNKRRNRLNLRLKFEILAALKKQPGIH